jgi:type IV fimbrial biogenesis protein FimT
MERGAMNTGLPRPRGFTVPELLATLAVAGIVATLALPGLNSAVADQRRATAVNGLVSTLQVARSAALTRNQMVTVCPSDDGQRCTVTPWEQGWIAFVDADRSGQPGADGLLVADPGLPPPVTLASTEFDGGLSFRPTGQVVAAAGAETAVTFALCEGGHRAGTRVLWLNVSGKPQLVDQQANGLPDPCGV